LPVKNRKAEYMTADLQKLAQEIRLETFEIIAKAGGGHFGGSLSEVEILTTLYFDELRLNTDNPKDHHRDRLILSKGHGGPALYVILARKGYFPREWLAELDKSGGRLPKHVDRIVPGAELSSGSLGQGLSTGIGMALACRLDKIDSRIYVVMGDGELDEGQCWEAAMCAAKYKLDNLTAIVDWNCVQVDGTCDEIMPTSPLDKKWAAFGWHVISVDGHQVSELQDALEKARNTRDQPTVIIARTIKGKGVSFMENQAKWHSGSVSDEQYKIAIAELERRIT
jgi:transketolase